MTNCKDSPILVPILTRILKADIALNPFLSAVIPATTDPEQEQDRVVWDMHYPSSFARCSSNIASEKSWLRRRKELATFPRMNAIEIVSRSFPWTITVHARNPDKGLRCGEVLDTIHLYLYTHLICTDMDGVSEDHRKAMSEVYESTRKRPEEPPAIFLSEGRGGMRKVDYLAANTAFQGLQRDDAYLKEKMGYTSPGTFLMVCGQVEPESSSEVVPPSVLSSPSSAHKPPTPSSASSS